MGIIAVLGASAPERRWLVAHLALGLRQRGQPTRLCSRPRGVQSDALKGVQALGLEMLGRSAQGAHVLVSEAPLNLLFNWGRHTGLPPPTSALQLAQAIHRQCAMTVLLQDYPEGVPTAALAHHAQGEWLRTALCEGRCAFHVLLGPRQRWLAGAQALLAHGALVQARMATNSVPDGPWNQGSQTADAGPHRPSMACLDACRECADPAGERAWLSRLLAQDAARA